MSGRSPPDDVSVDIAVRNALNDLPLVGPGSSAWPELQRQLLAQNIIVVKNHIPQRRYAWAAALAAGVLMAVLWLPGRESAPVDSSASQPAISAHAVASATTTLDSLRGESQRIESWLRQLSAGGGALNGEDLMAATEIEDLIGMVDLQLSAGATEDVDSASLWKQRVALLHDLAAIRATNYSLAVSDAGSTAGEPASSSWLN